MIIDYGNKVKSLLSNKGDKKVVFTNGCFDILHIGHIEALKDSSKMGELLIVGINGDKSVKELKGDSRPINSETNRLKFLEAIRWVDGVIIYTDLRATEAIKYCRPDVYTKSSDYNLENMDKGEVSALKELKAEIIITPLIGGFSTTRILDLY